MELLRSIQPPKPFMISDGNLTSSNVAETEFSVWSSVATYGPGDLAQIVSPSGFAATITIGVPAVISFTGHNLPVDTQIRFITTGALPTGIYAGVIYFVRDITPATFRICATPGGAPVNTSGTQSGTHTYYANRHDVWESLQASNTGNAPATSPTWWARADSTNRWRMFDASVSGQSSNVSSIAVQLAIADIVNAVALLNISAASIQVTQTDAVEGVVFDEIISGVELSAGDSFYDWCFEPIVRKTDMLVRLYPYLNSSIAITLTDAGGTVLCGACVPGKILDLGGTHYGMELGIDDYSVKSADAYGNLTVQERAYNRYARINVFVDNGRLDAFINALAAQRATPAVYIGSALYGASMAFGFYDSFSLVVSYPAVSLLSIYVKGLT